MEKPRPNQFPLEQYNTVNHPSSMQNPAESRIPIYPHLSEPINYRPVARSEYPIHQHDPYADMEAANAMKERQKREEYMRIRSQYPKGPHEYNQNPRPDMIYNNWQALPREGPYGDIDKNKMPMRQPYPHSQPPHPNHMSLSMNQHDMKPVKSEYHQLNNLPPTGRQMPMDPRMDPHYTQMHGNHKEVYRQPPPNYYPPPRMDNKEM